MVGLIYARNSATSAENQVTGVVNVSSSKRPSLQKTAPKLRAPPFRLTITKDLTSWDPAEGIAESITFKNWTGIKLH